MGDPRPLDFQPGDVLSALTPSGESAYFEVAERLGSGGAGVVFACYADGGQATIAKGPHHVGRSDRTLDREALLLERLPEHPNLPRLLGTQVDPRGHRLVFVERLAPSPFEVFGRAEVAPRLQRFHVPPALRVPPPVPIALALLYELALALEHLHGQKVAHCDVKPDNLMIRLDQPEELGRTYALDVARGRWRGVLIDFGGARDFRELAQASTGDDVLLPGFTPLYAPPEVLPGVYDPDLDRDRSRFSAAMDVYAFGLTAFVLLTGRAPYDHVRPRPDLRQLSHVVSVKRSEREGDVRPLVVRALQQLDWSDCVVERVARDQAVAETLEVLERLLLRTTHRDPRQRGPIARARRELGEVQELGPHTTVDPRIAMDWRSMRLRPDRVAGRRVEAAGERLAPKVDLSKIQRGSQKYWQG